MARTFRAPVPWRKIRQHRGAMQALGQYAPDLRAQDPAPVPVTFDLVAAEAGLTWDQP